MTHRSLHAVTTGDEPQKARTTRLLSLVSSICVLCELYLEMKRICLTVSTVQFHNPNLSRVQRYFVALICHLQMLISTKIQSQEATVIKLSRKQI